MHIALAPAAPCGWAFPFMSKVVFFVDGFNLYHALDYFEHASDHKRYHKYKWISLRRLARCYVTQKDSIQEILYFTTLCTWDLPKADRHKLFIRAQEHEGVSIVYGQFKRKDRTCRLCGRTFQTFEEKQTDVNIAIVLFQYAIKDLYDKAIIVSGDTDLIPAIKAVQSTFPQKQIGVVIPIGRASEDMKLQADFHHKMKERHLQSSRLPDTLALPDKSTLICPPTWR